MAPPRMSVFALAPRAAWRDRLRLARTRRSCGGGNLPPPHVSGLALASGRACFGQGSSGRRCPGRIGLRVGTRSCVEVDELARALRTPSRAHTKVCARIRAGQARAPTRRAPAGGCRQSRLALGLLLGTSGGLVRAEGVGERGELGSASPRGSVEQRAHRNRRQQRQSSVRRLGQVPRYSRTAAVMLAALRSHRPSTRSTRFNSRSIESTCPNKPPRSRLASSPPAGVSVSRSDVAGSIRPEATSRPTPTASSSWVKIAWLHASP